MFRDPARLPEVHPTYRMLAAAPETLKGRAESLGEKLRQAAGAAQVTVCEGVGYLGSGSLPTHELPTWLVKVSLPEIPTGEAARRLRIDDACIFTRIEDEQIVMDVRTITDDQIGPIAQAFARQAR
jgi:L-seryl-tRNA(Ser) seleniumtransferase